MNVTITTSTKAVSEVKGMSVVEPRFLKSKTELTIAFDSKKAFSEMNIQGDAQMDIEILGVEGEPLGDVIVTAEGVENFGRLFNRSIVALAKIGGHMDPISWEAKQGVVCVTFKDATMMDFPMVAEIMAQIAVRATGTLSGTQHPLTLFDMKQAIGVVQGVKDGNELSKDMDSWFKVRELTILEEVKAAKAAAKAKERASKAKEKAQDGEEDQKPASKGKAAPKAKKAASKKGVAKKGVAKIIPEDNEEGEAKN